MRAPAAAAPAVRAIRADLLDFTAAPAGGYAADAAAGVRWRPDHWLLVDAQGLIAAVQREDPGPGVERHDHRGRLLLPGFVDGHVHSPQVPVLASFGTALLDWLDTYTFPSETALADADHATRGTERFLDALLAHGTTAAAVFPTVHKASAEALFAGAAARGMRVVGGKGLMDRHAPDGLRDTVAQAERDCTDLIARWHGRGRCSYAVTVRFAPTSTPAQLAMAGALCRADPTLHMQTHLAENRDELRWVGELFPQARSYLAVYDDAGLLHGRSVLAHGIWLDADDRARLAATGAHVAHCPTSNLFLGSGLYAWRAALEAGHLTSLSSDVGGGTRLCLLPNAAAAYTVQALQGERLTAWVALHAATRGGAEALRLGHEIGTLEPGRMADLAVWDWSVGPLDAERQRVARGLHERVFAWMTLADERHLAATWVAGQERHRRTPP
ncbi:MAG: guanine deaminase [Betaproteobacteria bacterium]